MAIVINRHVVSWACRLASPSGTPKPAIWAMEAAMKAVVRAAQPALRPGRDVQAVPFHGSGLLAGLDVLIHRRLGPVSQLFAIQPQSASELGIRGFVVSLRTVGEQLRVVGVSVLQPCDPERLHPFHWSYDRSGGTEAFHWGFYRAGGKYELAASRPTTGTGWSATCAVHVAPGEIVPGPGPLVEVRPWGVAESGGSFRTFPGGAEATDVTHLEVHREDGLATAQAAFDAVLFALPGSDAFAASGRYPDSRLRETY